MTKHVRRSRRRAESRLFEAIAAADLGELRLAHLLLDHAVVPRRARATVIDHERLALRCLRPPPSP